jgi:hypothetical protein
VLTLLQGVDDAADGNGNVVVPVTAGLPAGAYRFGTIMSSATHQPVIAPIAQHGLIDDVIYVGLFSRFIYVHCLLTSLIGHCI